MRLSCDEDMPQHEGKSCLHCRANSGIVSGGPKENQSLAEVLGAHVRGSVVTDICIFWGNSNRLRLPFFLLIEPEMDFHAVAHET